MKKLLLALAIGLSAMACKEREEKKPDCGCDSEIIATIPEAQNITGKISYNVPTDPNDHFYVNKFWITTKSSGALLSVGIVCNESILPPEILQLKKTGGSLTVKYSGYSKKLCEGIVGPSTYSYDHIVLTKIELQ